MLPQRGGSVAPPPALYRPMMRRSLALLGLAAGLAACGGPAGPTAGPAAPTPSAPPPVACPDGERTLWQDRADLDGDGRAEDLAVTSCAIEPPTSDHDAAPVEVAVGACTDGGETCRATLHVGGATASLALTSGFFGGLGVAVVDVDRGDRRKELRLQQHTPGQEDPPIAFQLALYDGRTLKVQALWGSHGYNSGTIEIPGDGSVTVDYAECPDGFTVRYVMEGGALVEKRRTSRPISPLDECSG
jgi:hypothetical protein